MRSLPVRMGNSSSSGASPWWIVCISDLIWDEHWSSEQQLAARFAKFSRVLYVERPVSIFSAITGVSNAPVFRQVWRWLRSALRLERENLWVLTPPPFLPFRYRPLVNRFNQGCRIRAIRRAMRQLNISAPVLWMYEPDGAETVGELGERLSLYYCADDWSSSGQWWNRARDVLHLERQLVEKVDLVIASASTLAARWRSINPNTFFLPNAADTDLFETATSDNVTVPFEISELASPRIGFVGIVNARFNVDLYEKLSAMRRDWQWIIVGPVMTQFVDVSRLKSKTNVHFIGSRPRSEVPAYLKGFDVCTIPYVCNEHSEGIFPLKLFEYLAAGKPVVSTPLPELAPYKSYVRVAATAAEFVMGIEELLRETPDRVPPDFLRANSWNERVDRLCELIRRFERKVGGRE